MRNTLKSLYKKLPFIKELRTVQHLLEQTNNSLNQVNDSIGQIANWQCNRKLFQMSALIQTLEAIKSSNPKTALIEITVTNRFLMRHQLNLFACHESRIDELSPSDFERFPGFTF